MSLAQRCDVYAEHHDCPYENNSQPPASILVLYIAQVANHLCSLSCREWSLGDVTHNYKTCVDRTERNIQAHRQA